MECSPKRRREDELCEDVRRFNLDFKDIPAKLPPQTLQSNCSTSVRLNGYYLSFAKKDEPGYMEKVFKYRVTVAAQYPDRKVRNTDGTETTEARKEKWLHEGMKGDVPKSQRCNICYVVMETIAQKFFGFKGMEMVYDRVNTMYSSKQLCEINETRRERIEVAGNDKLEKLDTSFIGHPIAYNVAIDLVEIINPHAQEELGSLVQFLEIITSVKAYRSIGEALLKKEKPKVEVTKSKIYFPLESRPFNNDPRILMKGVDKSVRVIGDQIFNPKFVLQLDAKTSPFFPEGPLVPFLAKLLNSGRQFGGGGGGFRDRSSSSAGSYRDDSRGRGGRGSRDGSRDGRGGYDRRSGDGGSDRPEEELVGILRDNRKVDLASNHLKNVVVRTTHLGEKNKVFPIHGLADQIQNISFEKRDGSKEYVVERFRNQYRLNVNGRLPAVVHFDKARKVQNFYPMEVLEILPNQRVSVQKSQMEPNMTEIMTRECQQNPTVMTRLFEDAKREIHIQNSNPWLKHFGIKVDNDLIETNKGILVPAPDCVFAGNRRANLDRNQMNFRLDRDPLRQTPKHNIHWCLVDVQGCLGRDVDRFLDNYLRRCEELGFRLPRPDQRSAPDMRGSREDDFDRAFKQLKAESMNFVVFITRSKTDPSHEYIKFYESKYGILSQHILQKNAAMCKSDTLNNIILKTNLKLGGQNWTIKLNPLNVARPVIEVNRTMFIGIGFSQAGPQGVERVDTGASSIDTASIAYTIDPEFRLNGDWWYYEKQKGANAVPIGGGDEKPSEFEFEMARLLTEALQKWKSNNGSYPLHVVLYRNGTSEGEFAEIFKKEVKLLDEACLKLGSDAPTRTFMVAVNRSNNRIFKLARETNPNDRPPQQNVRAGTAYFSGLTHPRLTEFILQSHRSIQGTGRPVRYVVLNDSCSPRVPTEELINISNALAYTHGIVTSPVSLPSCLYAAQDLAERAQKHIKHARGSRSVKELNETVRPNVEHRFWA